MPRALRDGGKGGSGAGVAQVGAHQPLALWVRVFGPGRGGKHVGREGTMAPPHTWDCGALPLTVLDRARGAAGSHGEAPLY